MSFEPEQPLFLVLLGDFHLVEPLQQFLLGLRSDLLEALVACPAALRSARDTCLPGRDIVMPVVLFGDEEGREEIVGDPEDFQVVEGELGGVGEYAVAQGGLAVFLALASLPDFVSVLFVLPCLAAAAPCVFPAGADLFHRPAFPHTLFIPTFCAGLDV